MSAELKFFDTSVLDTLVAATGTVQTSLALIPQNVSQSGRVGRKCVATSLELRGNAFLVELAEATGPPKGELLRVLVVSDSQANGAVFAVDDVLKTTTINSPVNASNADRFAILSEEWFPLEYKGASGGGAGSEVDYAGVAKEWVDYLALDLPLEYDGETGAIDELATNNLAVLAISKSGLCGLQFTARLNFVG